MKPMFVRPMNGLNPNELERFQESYKASNGELGPEVLYPETTILVAGDVLFQPVQSCYVMGSLGYGDVSRLELASAMRQVVMHLASASYQQGRGDIMFIGGHPDSDNYAKNNGFEKVERPVYRLRLPYKRD